jgi:TrmH family RNA methyltransferase
MAQPPESQSAKGARGARKPINAVVRRVLAARGDSGLVVLEGFHALKHALRFGAQVEVVVAVQDGQLDALVGGHAPELAGRIEQLTVRIPRADFKRMGAYEPHTGVVAIAARPLYDLSKLLSCKCAGAVVAIEDPRHRGNLGAVVRVAAAAGAAGVLGIGGIDPWHATTVRGAAGLQFALPVGSASLAQLRAGGRTIIALDPAGESLRIEAIPPAPILLFGSERSGLSEQARALAKARYALPMRPGVSSLNLATSVAAVLYALELAR